MQRAAAVALMVAALGTSGCDFVTKARGVMKAAQQVGEHLEKDLKAPLTDAKISKVLKITPELQEFSKQAEHKWNPDPRSGDVAQLSAAMGALSEYMAFFEARDTRLTEYWVDLMKTHDAYAQIAWRRAQAESRARLETERQELEAQRDAGELSDAEAEQRLEQNRLALENLEQMALNMDAARQPDQGQGEAPYRLSDEEVALVEARFDEIQGVFRGAGYVEDAEADEVQ